MRLALLPENHLGKRTLLQKWRRSVKASQICQIFFPLIRGELSLIPVGRENIWVPNFAGISIVWEFDRFIIFPRRDLCDSAA